MAAEACQRIEHGFRSRISHAVQRGPGSTRQPRRCRCHGRRRDHGPLAPGMADFPILDMMHPECLPSHDFEWELVRYHNRDQVDALVVDGRLCMAQGRPVADENELREAGLAAAKAITSAPDIQRCHGPSDFIDPRHKVCRARAFTGY